MESKCGLLRCNSAKASAMLWVKQRSFYISLKTQRSLTLINRHH